MFTHSSILNVYPLLGHRDMVLTHKLFHVWLISHGGAWRSFLWLSRITGRQGRHPWVVGISWETKETSTKHPPWVVAHGLAKQYLAFYCINWIQLPLPMLKKGCFVQDNAIICLSGCSFPCFIINTYPLFQFSITKLFVILYAIIWLSGCLSFIFSAKFSTLQYCCGAIFRKVIQTDGQVLTFR